MRQYWDPEMLAAVESVFVAIGKGRYDVDDVEARRQYSRRQEAAVTPDEVAAAICFLASPLAGSTTGAAVEVDGGMAGLRLRPRGE